MENSKINALSEVLKKAAADRSIPAAHMVIYRSGEKIFDDKFGIPSVFDIASVTKLFTTSAFMRLVDMNRISPDDFVCSVLPEFTGLREVHPFPEPLIKDAVRDVSNGFTGPVDAGKITFRHLLTHSSGLPAWLPLYRLDSTSKMRETVLNTCFSYEPGSDVVYSDLGLIIVGWAVETLAGKPLEDAVRELVLEPLELRNTCYKPENVNDTAPTDICHWRKRRLLGEVEDENCAALGGVSGHAGIFSTADDLARFGCAFLPPSDFLRAESLAHISGLYASSRDGLNNRGYGFQHWSADLNAFYYPMSSDSFGHTGFTGTALWIDPARDVSIALMSNEVYNGRANRKIADFRRTVFAAIPEFLEEA